MRVSYQWLKELVEFDLTPEALAEHLTMLGMEIESIEQLGKDISNVFVGRILSIENHPSADKLVVCKTDVGSGDPRQIICGAKNMSVGDLVPTAVEGATLPGGFSIGKRKMRGIESFGMMCSSRELGLGEDQEGLLILDPSMKVGENILTALGLDDAILEIEITPNRGDWAGMIGVARELAASLQTTLKIPGIQIEESQPPASALSSVMIEAPDLCPRYVGRVLTDVTVGPSPLWLAQRLTRAGMRPINNIVDITNYVMVETGQPLHAFDLGKLRGECVVIRESKQDETIETIDGTIRGLPVESIVIADTYSPVAVAGVMGGKASEVTDSTTRILLESAAFDPRSIRKTSRALSMITESSQRFQRGCDPEMAMYASLRAAMLMQQLAGAKVAAGALDAYPAPRTLVPIRLRFRRTEALLGASIPSSEQRNILTRLGLSIISDSETDCQFSIPSWRNDLALEADLIEEIARLHGFSRIDAVLPKVRATAEVLTPLDSRQRSLRKFLLSMGITEFISLTFSSPEELKKCRLDSAASSMVTLVNPLAETQSTMRVSLLPSLLRTASLNVKAGMDSIAGFEIGAVYRTADRVEDLPLQQHRLGILLCGHNRGDWSEPARPFDFFDIKGYVESILERTGLPGAFASFECATFQSGQCAHVVLDGNVVGTVGLIGREVLQAFEIDRDVYIAELDADAILAMVAPPARFEAMPKFPSVLRDAAFLVDKDTPSGALLDTARRACGALLKSIALFDVFTGKQLPSGSKSVGVRMVFRSADRTLTDDDIEPAIRKVVEKLNNEFRAQLR